jgi:hypothetical protein
MRHGSDQDGQQHERQLQRLPQRKGIRVGGNSLPNGAGHQCGQWLFDNCVKEPENNKPHGQAKKEEATRGVPEGAFGREPEEKFQIRSKRTNDQRRQN